MKIKDEAVAGIVAGAAFVASAEHIIHVVTTTGGSTYTGWTYPLGIDGLVYVGIMAARRGRRLAGLAAITIGAAYSLAFNGDALGAFQLSRLLIAASMPICMLAAFVIVHSGHRDAVDVDVVDAPSEDVDVDVVEVYVEPLVPPVQPVPSVPAVASKPSGTGRAPAWDVDKAVQLIRDGLGNEEIGDALGISYKPVQRTRRAVAMIDADEGTDEEIGKACGVSAAHVAKVRSAVTA